MLKGPWNPLAPAFLHFKFTILSRHFCPLRMLSVMTRKVKSTIGRFFDQSKVHVSQEHLRKNGVRLALRYSVHQLGDDRFCVSFAQRTSLYMSAGGAIP